MGTLIVEERFHFKMLETAMDLLQALGRLEPPLNLQPSSEKRIPSKARAWLTTDVECV